MKVKIANSVNALETLNVDISKKQSELNILVFKAKEKNREIVDLQLYSAIQQKDINDVDSKILSKKKQSKSLNDELYLLDAKVNATKLKLKELKVFEQMESLKKREVEIRTKERILTTREKDCDKRSRDIDSSVLDLEALMAQIEHDKSNFENLVDCAVSEREKELDKRSNELNKLDIDIQKKVYNFYNDTIFNNK